MPKVHFSPIQGSVGDYVLNHPTASPFQKHSIAFHIDGNYMTDFTQDGIKRFVKDNNRKLDYKEVGSFIQSVASNAPNVAGATFDLEDKELGLYKKDDVNRQHIEKGFVLETKSGSLPSQGVVFFDATKSEFHLLEAEKAVEKAEKNLDKADDKLDDAKDDLDDAKYYRQRLVDFLGKDSPKELAEKQARITDLNSYIKVLEEEKADYQTELKQLEDEHANQPANPPSGLDPSSRWQKIVQLKRALRGLDIEMRESQKDLKGTRKAIDKNRGPLSFIGVGNSLADLEKRNSNLQKAQTAYNSARKGYNTAKSELDDAKALRDRILKGESIVQKPPQPAPKPAEPKPQPAQPPAPPVAEEPKPAQPPAQPVVDEPITPTPGGDVIKPNPQPSQPTQPPAPPVAEEPKPAQPPVPPVVEEPVAPTPPPSQPAPQPTQPAQPPSQPVAGGRPDELFIPGGRHNPTVIHHPHGQQPAPAQPVQPAPSQPTPQPTQPAPVQPAPPAQPSQPTAPVDLSPGSGIVSKYTVKSGDTLSSIARTELGDWTRWREVANMNREVIGNQNHWIYPGQVLTLPPLQVQKPAY